MKRYVLGFAMSPDRERVVMIRKSRPEWQRGLLNGVGGHIEPTDESPHAAMVREFAEETGLLVTAWRQFARMLGEGWEVHVFVSVGVDVFACSTQTDEPVLALQLSAIKDLPAISNIGWLLEMAADTDATEHPLTVVYRNSWALVSKE